MSAPDTCVFDLTPPRRPGINDLGGAQKIDDGEISDPVGMPMAEEDNQQQEVLQRVAGISPVAIVSVHYAAGVPSINKLIAVSIGVTIPTFTVIDTATGDCSLTWAANTFPPAVADPEAAITGATVGMCACESIANGVRIRLKNSAGVDTDLNFNVKIF